MKSVNQAVPGTKLETVFADGRVRSTIDGDLQHTDDPRLRKHSGQPERRSRRKKAAQDDGPGLFES